VRNLIVLLLSCYPFLFALGQGRSINAIKTDQAPSIDADLSDAVWANAPVATEFIQSSPNYGAPSTAKKTVKILYDNAAVYIGAYIYDDPSLIRKQLTARDGEQRQDVDYFSVFFDTYNDQQNGFQFLVTTANVQSDAKLNPNANTGFGEYGDRTWDAVWQSKVSIQPDGWVVEMKIPYISLRFPKRDIQTWGLQFLHFTRRNNETSYWNPVNPEVNGFINQFGKYENIVNIRPPLRLSFSPYLSGGVRYNPEGTGVDHEVLRSGGMDVKYGINESFTIDATLIPDFGQVVSDNIINNLSPFEVKFQENRPFFTEGTEIFNKSGLFYSRRIGAIPGEYYNIQATVDANTDLEIIQNPSVTQLYNAIKFSGRTKEKLGIGVFNAITAPMHATIRDHLAGRDYELETEPMTNYNIVVLDQALKNRSSVTFTNTNVIRSGASRDANVTALDWALYTRNNKFRIKGTGRYSQVFGYTPYRGNINLVDDTLRMNGKLYVKPYDGFSATVGFAKVSGKLQFLQNNSVESNTYDPNDMGYLQSPNKITHDFTISWNQLTATKNFIQYKYTIGARLLKQYDPFAYNSFETWTTAFWIFRNFWDVTINVGSQPKGQHDYFELRTPKRYLKRPSFYYASLEGSSDSRKRLFGSWKAGYTKSDIEDGNYYSFEPGIRYRFSNSFSLSLNVAHQVDMNQVGYAFVRETNGEPIIGFRKNVETSSVLSGIYNFTPRLNLTLRTRHYWNNVHYNKFFNVAPDGSYIPRPFLQNLDENYNLFNVDAFVTWDFRLGSRVILGWKNWIGNPYGVTDRVDYFYNLKNMLRTDHGNELTVKLIYFLDYNELRKK
jgi:hypothetical protein